MPAAVSSVKDGSIAQELGIESGDIILKLDGVELADLIDYNFYCKNEVITLEILKKSGQMEEIEIEKDYDEDLGIIFESAVFDKIHPCMNRCIFCFVDRQPKGLRETLYIKDDDYRLSYLQGTYITLTNLSRQDRERIKKLRLGPFYISVHTTNPELRVKMLRNPNASRIMEELNMLKSCGIPFHAQIVLCPGYNDQAELVRTLDDLSGFGSCLLSIAVVPVGITDYGEKSDLKRVNKKTAKETIEIVSKYKKACCSDEFFILADEKIPPAEYYGNFPQLNDGVGSIRMLLDDFNKYKLPGKLRNRLSLTFATSYAAYTALNAISRKLNLIEGLFCKVKPVKSNYWGGNITVAGLITSGDLIETLKGDESDFAVIPSVMLKPFSELFLDGASLDFVKNETKKEFLLIKDQYSLKELVDFIYKYT